MSIKAGLRHTDFSTSAEFFACGVFSDYPHSNFHQNVDCFKMQIPKDLDKIKIVNISNINFSIMASKTSLLLRDEIDVVLFALIYRRKKRMKQRRERNMWVLKLVTERRTKDEFNILVKDLMLFDHLYFF